MLHATKVLEIDSTTLRDLEVFGPADGQGGLFELIDRTSTAIGRQALRQHIAQPPRELAAIRRTQDAVAFLRARAGIIVFRESSIEPVARYLRSNITSDAGSRLREQAEYAWMSVRFRDLLNEIRAGTAATSSLFEYVARMCSRLSGHDPPELIAGLTRELAATAEVVLHTRADALTVLGEDHAYRFVLRPVIERALRLIAELDALQSMASATAAFGWVMPDFVETDGFLLEADGVHHPFVPDPVRNPVRLSGGEPMVFLTGPNMAGKTTYLRSVALLVLLAHTGMGVPATRMRLTPLDTLFTSLSPADNLRAGLSYFLAEVLRVKAAATLLAEGRRALVIFDEVFKGTNVRDALEASAEVILGFARARRSGFIFSSHLAELVEVLHAEPAIRFCCFDGDIQHGAPRYSYVLRDGVSDKRFGLLLLHQAEIPELLARIPR